MKKQVVILRIFADNNLFLYVRPAAHVSRG